MTTVTRRKKKVLDSEGWQENAQKKRWKKEWMIYSNMQLLADTTL